MPTKGFTTSQLLNVALGRVTLTLAQRKGYKSTARDSSHNTAAGKESQDQHVEEAKVPPPVHIISHDACAHQSVHCLPLVQKEINYSLAF